MSLQRWGKRSSSRRDAQARKRSGQRENQNARRLHAYQVDWLTQHAAMLRVHLDLALIRVLLATDGTRSACTVLAQALTDSREGGYRL